jgi:hypothetical protein
MDMNEVLRSLEEIDTVYTVFEKDQVLTDEQLNGVVRYLDDQRRLASVRLVGVGIGCGLRPSIADGVVKVTRGAGVTTDGDLVSLPADTIYDRFKAYDESAPRYAPFYSGETRVTLYELLEQGVDDPQATPLGSFGATTGQSLAEQAVVMLMESYVKDEDLCTGNDCDNLGKDAANTVKALLVDADTASGLLEALRTPRGAAANLREIVIARPAIPTGITTPAAFAVPYRATCATLDAAVRAQLARIYQECGPLFEADLPADPFPQWGARLDAIKASFAERDAGIQYYYDFLKDLAETFNDFVRVMSEDSTVCCPSTGAFPKHLVLGGLDKTAAAAAVRTGFYPSPMVGGDERGEHARLLVSKIGALMAAFRLPQGAGGAVRIVPSHFEDRCLEDRAIPYYYAVGGRTPIQEVWSYELARRGLGACNYSYNAADYGATGAAASPLTASIGRFPFFRIEGHVGNSIGSVVETLTSQIRAGNLPFTVRAVVLGSERGHVTLKPVTRYSDLHRVHYMLRQAAANELDDVVKFSGALRKEVDDNSGALVASAESDYGGSLKRSASDRDSTVTAAASSARGKLATNYSAFRSDATWKSDVRAASSAAGSFKSEVAGVARTEFTTPFDTLVGGRSATAIDLLGRIIEDKSGKEDDRLLFTNFVAQHPGVDHLGGVGRGGTFVLVYDSTGTVVGDFMLAEYWPETSEEEDEPALKADDFKPSQIGVRLVPTIDKTFTTKLQEFRTGLEPQLTQQKDYLQLFRDSIGVLGGAISGSGRPTTPTVVTRADEVLDTRVSSAEAASNKLIALRGVLGDTTDPALRGSVQAAIDRAEGDLVDKIDSAMVYLGEGSRDVSAGSQGGQAIETLVKSAANVTGTSAAGQLATRVSAVSAGATSDVKVQLTRIVPGRG